MLPDYPDEKQKLMDFFNDYLQQKIDEKMRPFSYEKRFLHHEGNRWRIDRSDGSSLESTYDEVSGGFTIEDDEAINLTPDQIIGKLDIIADEMAAQMTRNMLRTMINAAIEAGKSIDPNRKPFTKELFLEMITHVQIDFDRDGNPIMPTLIVPPGFDKSILEEWTNDPEMTKSYEELIRKKKEEWNARETRRKLVD